MDIIIKNGDMKLSYNFNRLTVIQVELAREVGEWKLQQLELPANDFNAILRSRGAEYLPIMCSFLMTPKKGNKVEQFNYDNCKEIEEIIKTAPASQLDKLKEVISDFFLNIGNSEISSTLLQSRLERQKQEALLKTLLAISTNMKNISEDNNQLKEDTIPEKSKDE